jgi:hypothetical protein
MTWRMNKYHEVTVKMYNELDPITLEGGISLRGKSDDVTLYGFVIKTGSMFFYNNDGRFASDGLIIQFSRQELEKNDFEIIPGKTHIILESNEYRVAEMEDYSMYKFTQLIECRCVKMLHVD